MNLNLVFRRVLLQELAVVRQVDRLVGLQKVQGKRQGHVGVRPVVAVGLPVRRHVRQLRPVSTLGKRVA